MDPNAPILSVQHLNKKIGRRWIVKDVTFNVFSGQVFGFLGPNGAGKTTTIRMLVNLIKPTGGHIYICGHPVTGNSEHALQHVGTIVENPEAYHYLTGWENLELFARMYVGIDEHQIQQIVHRVGLTDRIHEKVLTYSLGMRQRLGIAQALLNRPKLLILDEPTNGLDPKGIKQLRVFIRKLADEGMAVFISSHLLNEVQLLCDTVAIINDGRVLLSGTIKSLIQDQQSLIIWDVEPFEQGRFLLEQFGTAFVFDTDERTEHRLSPSLRPNSIGIKMDEKKIPEMVKKMVDAGINIHGIRREEQTLEQLFLKMTEGERIG